MINCYLGILRLALVSIIMEVTEGYQTIPGGTRQCGHALGTIENILLRHPGVYLMNVSMYLLVCMW